MTMPPSLNPETPNVKTTKELYLTVHCAGGSKQKGIISYGIAPNRQFPLAGAAHDALFNTWRRFRGQVLYWAPPLIAGYYVIQWAVQRYAKSVRDM